MIYTVDSRRIKKYTYGRGFLVIGLRFVDCDKNSP